MGHHKKGTGFWANVFGDGSNHHGGGYKSGYDHYPPASTQPMQTKACFSCNGMNAVNAKFCNQCGMSLLPKQCKQCNASLQQNARFCQNCGSAS